MKKAVSIIFEAAFFVALFYFKRLIFNDIQYLR